MPLMGSEDIKDMLNLHAHCVMVPSCYSSGWVSRGRFSPHTFFSYGAQGPRLITDFSARPPPLSPMQKRLQMRRTTVTFIHACMHAFCGCYEPLGTCTICTKAFFFSAVDTLQGWVWDGWVGFGQLILPPVGEGSKGSTYTSLRSP